MSLDKFLLTLTICAASGLAQSQGLDPTEILKPLKDNWPTYSGDYSGKRHSALTQINQSNVKNLTLAWARWLTAGSAAGGGFGFGRALLGGPPVPMIVGGEGSGEAGG